MLLLLLLLLFLGQIIIRDFRLLRGLDTLGNFCAIFTRDTTFVTSCLLSCTPSSF